MPRKTKKRKILAEKRRKAILDKKKKISSEGVKTQKENHTDSLFYSYAPNSKPSPKSISKPPLSHDYSWVYSDILKMFVFALLAMASQIVLYFILQG